MRFDVQKIKQYSIMPTRFINDKRLSLQAKGLLAFIYSVPDDWDFSMAGLCKCTNTKITRLRSALDELLLFGYIKRLRTHNSNGHFEYVYFVRTAPRF